MDKENTNKALLFKKLIYKNHSGIQNVYKITTKTPKGYYWTYERVISNKTYSFRSKSLKTLKYKVLKNNLPWKILDEEHAKQSYINDLKDNKKIHNFTGIWRVTKIQNFNNPYYGCWKYRYRENNEDIRIIDEDLKKLKEKVENENLPWIILDKEIAKLTFDENEDYLNIYNSGIKQVTKLTSESLPLSFIWAYYYWKNNKRERIRSTNLIVLERKVKDEKLPWLIFDENLAKKSYKENEEWLKNHHQKTSSGIYLVAKHKDEKLKQGFTWNYQYYANKKHKMISSVNLHDLEEKVKSKNLSWIIIDDELAKENYKKYEIRD